MSWAKVDDAVTDNPKTLAVWSQDPGAFGLDLRGIAYCARHLTDGFLADAALDQWFAGRPDGERERLVDVLLEAGRWHRVEGGFEIHDYLDYNPTKEQVLATRARRAVSGARGGAKSRRRRAK